MQYSRRISKNFLLLVAMIIAFVLCTITNVHAEYRAYQYLLDTQNPEQKNSTIITTSLTPVAMTRYYGISKQKLFLLRTWICPGHTGGKKTCQPPYISKNLDNFLLEPSGEDL